MSKGFYKGNHLTDNIKTHSGVRPYNCKNCNKHFTTKSCLKRHNLTHSKERPCHIRTHGSDRNFKCDICGIAFALKSRLVKHELIHRGEKPYECETGQDGRRYVCSIYGKGFKQVTTNWIISRFTLEWGPTSVSTVSKDSWQTDMCLPTQKSTRVNVKFV